MITVKAFKEQHNLSDSAFKRLVRKAKRQYSNGDFTRRINSTDWEVLHPEILESLITYTATDSTDDFISNSDSVTTSPTEIQPLNLSFLPSIMVPPFATNDLIPDHSVSTLGDLTGQDRRLVQGHSEVSMALEVVQQTRQLVGYVLSVQRQQANVDDQQVEQLEDAAYELHVHASCLKREDRKTAIQQGYRNQRRKSAQSDVVQLRDFFDRRTVSQP